MSRKIYIGTDVSKKIKALYVGSGDIAHKIKSAYIGVNDVAHKFWPISYKWNRYTVESVTKYREGLSESRTDLYSRSSTGGFPYMPPLYNSYTFNELTGEYTGTGGSFTPNNTTQSVSGYLLQSNYTKGYVVYIESRSSSTPSGTRRSVTYEGYRFTTSSYREDAQGNYIDQVTSENRNAYPDNGISGSYWYVYQGEA